VGAADAAKASPRVQSHGSDVVEVVDIVNGTFKDFTRNWFPCSTLSSATPRRSSSGCNKSRDRKALRYLGRLSLVEVEK